MMRSTGIVRKAARYGFRHLVRLADYRTGIGLAPPEGVGITLTHRCNCRCLMCDLWKLDDCRTELRPERWIEILEELHAWIGSFRLAVNGGEIFLKSGVYDILRRAVELGLTVNPVSNGLIFKSDHHFRSLLDTGLPAITFSLDGMDASIHDRHRGTDGVHRTVCEVIRRIKSQKPRMSVSVICILMRETAPQLPEFAKWAEDVGVDNILFQPIAEPAGRPVRQANWYRESELFITDLQGLDRSMGELIRWQAATNRIELPASTLRSMQDYFANPAEFQIKGRRCMLGETELRINPQGVLYLCDVRHTTIGHVDDAPIRETWRGDRARMVRRLIRECRRPCAALCHRSPGLREKISVFARYVREGRI